jgi:hypothetical protein
MLVLLSRSFQFPFSGLWFVVFSFWFPVSSFQFLVCGSEKKVFFSDLICVFQTIFELEGNVLKQTQRGIKDKDFISTIEREFTSDGLTAVCEMNGQIVK